MSKAHDVLWKLKSFVSREYLRLPYFGLLQSHKIYGLLKHGDIPCVVDVLLSQKRLLQTSMHVITDQPLQHVVCCQWVNLYLRGTFGNQYLGDNKTMSVLLMDEGSDIGELLITCQFASPAPALNWQQSNESYCLPG